MYNNYKELEWLETYLNDRFKGTSPLVGHQQAIAHEFLTTIIAMTLQTIRNKNAIMHLSVAT